METIGWIGVERNIGLQPAGGLQALRTRLPLLGLGPTVRDFCPYHKQGADWDSYENERKQEHIGWFYFN
jgi:hypothetical protein